MAKIVVYPHKIFNAKCIEMAVNDDNVSDFDNVFIDIVNTKECQELFKKDISTHYFKESHDNVLLLVFDDIEEDEVCDGRQLKALSNEQAEMAVDFIEKNIGKDIMVCCIAGKSRSQAFFRFVTDFYPSDYQFCQENEKNPCISPNVDVVAKLKRAYYKKHGLFVDENIDF